MTTSIIESTSISSLPSSQDKSLLIPKSTAPEATWQKFLIKSTELDGYDGVRPQKAEIIFLGDIHSQASLNRWRGAIIDHYGSSGDIVLCEGEESCESVPQSRSSFDAQKKFNCYGWDDSDIYEKSIKEVETICGLITKYEESAPSAKWSLADRMLWKIVWHKIQSHSNTRTQSLIKTVKIALDDLTRGKKIFVIAGSDHLSLNRTHFNIRDHFKGYKTTLLLPKDVSTNIKEDIMKYAKTLISS